METHSSNGSAAPSMGLVGPGQRLDLKAVGASLETSSAEERVKWALDQFPTQTVLSSSFGAQSAVLLHLVTRHSPDVPVILVDTGYLFPETYQFIDQLTERLQLNLKVFRSEMSPAWQEARYGKLWEQGVEGIERYNTLNKSEPMNEAIQELGARAWISGVRRQQSSSRGSMDALVLKKGVLKVHPIIDWTDKDIFDYLKKHDLPYHPLWEEGYTSIGDWHTSHKLTDGMNADEARFFGLKRECGLHEDTESVEDAADYVI